MAIVTPKIGHGTAVGLGQETTSGTPVAITKWFRPYAADVGREMSIMDRDTLAEDSGSLFSASAPSLLSDFVRPSFEVQLEYEGMGMLWKNLLWGTPSSSGAGPYEHTYPLSVVQPAALTLMINHGNGAGEVLAGFRGNTWEITVAPGQRTKMKVAGFAQTSGGFVSAGTPAYTTNEVPALPQQCVVTWNSLTAQYKTMTIKGDNTLEERPLVGSVGSADTTPSGLRTVSVDAEVEYSAGDYYTAFQAQTESDMVITFTSGTKIIVMTINDASIRKLGKPISRHGVITQSVTFMGRSDGTNLGFNVVITNAQATALVV